MCHSILGSRAFLRRDASLEACNLSALYLGRDTRRCRRMVLRPDSKNDYFMVEELPVLVPGRMVSHPNPETTPSSRIHVPRIEMLSASAVVPSLSLSLSRARALSLYLSLALSPSLSVFPSISLYFSLSLTLALYQTYPSSSCKPHPSSCLCWSAGACGCEGKYGKCVGPYGRQCRRVVASTRTRSPCIHVYIYE